MKQLIQNIKTGQTRIVDIPTPIPSENSALIRNAASLVSVGTERMVVEFAQQSLIGKAKSRPDLVRQVLEKARREGLITTLAAATNKLEQPMVLGYSSAGTIIEMGEAIKGLRVGDRVACGGGGFAVHAEFVNVPQNLIVKLPDGVDFESAAFATLGAVAMQGFRLAKMQVGESIAVIGLGLLGLLSALIARAAGMNVLGIDLDPDRIKLAEKLGFRAVTNENAIEAGHFISGGHGVDGVLICADTKSDEPVILAGEIARSKANIVAVGAVGLNIPRKLYYEKELNLTVSRSYGPGRYDPQYEEKGIDYPIDHIRWTEGRNMQAFIGLLADHQVDLNPLITHRFAIEDAPKAYKMITSKSHESFLGVLLTYPDQDKAPERKIINLAAPTIQVQPGNVLSLGVLGAGNYALSTFLPVIQSVSGIAPAGVVSASGVSAEHAASKFGFGFASSDPNEIFSDPTINIIAILTRHHLHTNQILQAFENGKHVYCEKPLAIDETQLKRLKKALSQTGNPMLMAGFNRRFAPLAIDLKKFFSGRSEPMVVNYRANAGFLPLTHWIQDPLQGGGRIVGEACHFIDFLTYLIGENPTSVSVHGLDDLGKYHEDNVAISFDYPDGSFGTVTYLANGDKSFSKERVEVFCGGKVGVLEDYSKLELIGRGKIRRTSRPMKMDKGHKAAWQAFLSALTTKNTPPIPYDQLLGTTQASLAAVKALRTGLPQSLILD